MLGVRGANCLEAWQTAAHEIIEARGEIFNLIVEIDDPVHVDPAWARDYSPKNILATADDIRDVVDTIFPSALRDRFRVRSDFYAAYLRRHRRAMRFRRNAGKWGTYFERLLAFGPTRENQLETAIEKLTIWPRNTTGLVFHLSSANVDRPRTRGGPCWHYGQLLWHEDDSIDLLVVYRNHDYFNKALGNFVGLGKLLSFIADESGKRPGRLICHSTHGYTDTQGRLRTLAKL